MSSVNEENISSDEEGTAASIYDQLFAGTFYQNVEKAAKELGLTVRYVDEKE